MRIAMIGHKHFGSREGGIEVVVTEIARRLAGIGHSVTCYDRSSADVMTGSVSPSVKIDDSGVRVVPVATLDRRGLAALTSSFSATIKAIRDKQEVVHYHAEGPCVPLPIASLFGIRTVVTVHGLDWRCTKWGRFARAYIELGEKMAVKFADEIIVLSHDLQNYFEEKYHRTTICIPNGVSNPDIACPDLISEKWGLECEDYFLYLGRIVPDKGLESLIRAYQAASVSRRLVIAGGGSDTFEYENKLRHDAGAVDGILFTGYVSGRIYDELFSNAAAFILPSEHEGMPMSLLEAMAHGRCCISSDIDVCKEILSDCGLLVPVGDDEALREALEFVEENPEECTRLGGLAKERAQKEYGWDDVIQRTVSVYSR